MATARVVPKLPIAVVDQYQYPWAPAVTSTGLPVNFMLHGSETRHHLHSVSLHKELWPFCEELLSEPRQQCPDCPLHLHGLQEEPGAMALLRLRHWPPAKRKRWTIPCHCRWADQGRAASCSRKAAPARHCSRVIHDEPLQAEMLGCRSGLPELEPELHRHLMPGCVLRI